MRTPFLMAFLAVLPALGMTVSQPAPAVKQAKVSEKVNPFFTIWKTPYGVPPFNQIKPEHYLPAFKAAIAAWRKELDTIKKNPAQPTFQNTVGALDDSGEFLERVNSVFSGLSSAETNEQLQAIDNEVAPMLAAINDDINLDPDLFKRVKAVYDQRESLKLTPEQKMLLDRNYKGFVRGGANLSEEQKTRLRAINQELSVLGVKFGDNVLKDTQSYKLVISKREDLAGLPEGIVAMAAETAKDFGMDGKWVYTLQAPSIWPFLQYAQNRELRRQIMDAYLSRCDHNDATDNKIIAAKIVALRVESAQLLGYQTHADFVQEMTMAKNPAGVMGLMEPLWRAALKRAKRELVDLQALADKEGSGIRIEPCDWRFYAEKLKKAKYDLDEETLRPYLPLERVRQGAFTLAKKLYGITFKERKALPVYHKEVKAYEVKEKSGRFIGILYMDDHPRPGKRGGAWCSAYRKQWIKNGRMVTPVVVNVGNYARPTGGKPALLNLEEAETIFHEFGHALHQLLSHCRYAGLSGTSVPRDFVELPSQIMENWVTEPQMLKLYARHYQTGEVIPDALIQKIQDASLFDQGFAKTEFLAAVLLDMDWSTLSDTKERDAAAFEKASLEKWGLIPEIPVRYRTPYFLHLFVWGYSAGYYSYMWCEVLDADAFQAFKETGNLFDPTTAKAFRKNVLEKGGSEEPAILFRRFRGRDPKTDALLEKRGLK